MKSDSVKAIRMVVKECPEIRPFLSAKARWASNLPDAYKTYDYFYSQLTRMVKNLYAGNIGREFIDIMGSLLFGQFRQAHEQAWADDGNDTELPAFLVESYESLYLAQFPFVEGFYNDITDAAIDKTPIDPLLARVSLWANRWSEAYDTAVHLIALETGGKEEWKLGATEEHCVTCSALNGIVAYASEWDNAGVHPQRAPNSALECGGWHCDCSREPTSKRHTRSAYDKIIKAIAKG